MPPDELGSLWTVSGIRSLSPSRHTGGMAGRTSAI